MRTLIGSREVDGQQPLAESMEPIDGDAQPENLPVVNFTQTTGSARRARVCVVILFSVNLLNYMDRFTVAAVLTDLRTYFKIGDADAGLMQTVFVCSFMLFAPLFGFCGDRFSRKLIMLIGILIWSISVLASTFVTRHQFGLFMVLRAIVGIGEASYTTVAPTIIADLFTDDARSKTLMLFYFAIPVGSGLGFVVGSGVSSLAAHEWQWGVRVTPILGLICCVVMYFFLIEPPRGCADGRPVTPELEEGAGWLDLCTSWTNDLLDLCKNKSYVWSTAGFTCVAFVAGSLTWWAASYFLAGQKLSVGTALGEDTIDSVFGGITCVAGVVGVTSGSLIAQFWRHHNPRADPLVCGIGQLISAPLLFLSLVLTRYSMPATWYVVVPSRRSTASAFQILLSHLLGDASSPYIIGQMSDALQVGALSSRPPDVARYYALQYSMYLPVMVCVLGAFFFFGTAWFIEADRRKAHLLAEGILPETPSVSDLARDAINVDSELPEATDAAANNPLRTLC